MEREGVDDGVELCPEISTSLRLVAAEEDVTVEPEAKKRKCSEEVATVSSISSEVKITIHLLDNEPLVWSPADVVRLRSDWRICGTPIGQQGPTHSEGTLPVKLLPEQARLLADKGVVEFVKFPQLKSKPDAVETDALMEEHYNVQADDYVRERKSALESMRDSIVRGKKKRKKRKRSSESGERTCGEEDSLESLMSRIKPFPKEKMHLPLLNCRPDDSGLEVDFKFPTASSDRLKCAVFGALWERGYYVTSGLKFGGDYLVYLGDPIKYHASYIAVCWPNEKTFSGTSTKKTLLVCSVAGDGGVIFHSFAYKSVS